MRGPLIRVGGGAKYNFRRPPKIFSYPPKSIFYGRGSNWGKECVDILAPGQAIPVLKQSGKAKISNGTSDAAAILSGAIALLASCRPHATADEIRQAILNNSDEYQEELGAIVDRGRVLNIYKAVSNFCVFPKKIRHKPKNV